MQRILIQPFLSGWRCALLKDGTLIDFAFERLIQTQNANLDDIVCGRVTALKYLNLNGWDSGKALASLCKGENVMPLIKFRSGERKYLEDHPELRECIFKLDSRTLTMSLGQISY